MFTFIAPDMLLEHALRSEELLRGILPWLCLRSCALCLQRLPQGRVLLQEARLSLTQVLKGEANVPKPTPEQLALLLCSSLQARSSFGSQIG